MNSHNIQLNIPLNFKQVLDLVKQLSPTEKQQLRDVLWAEQNIDDIQISEEHKQIVRERIIKYENNPSSYLSWDELEHKMAARK